MAHVIVGVEQKRDDEGRELWILILSESTAQNTEETDQPGAENQPTTH